MTNAAKLAIVYDIDDFVGRFNAQPDAQRYAREHGRDKYNRWKIYRVLKACGVEFSQEVKGADGARGSKIYVTHRALAKALDGELLNSLLDVEALNDDAGLSGANHGGAGL